jgi:glycosyltransferase involved in cell wall biosynthesis
MRTENMSVTPRSVLMVTPRWARDGGVGAHVQASAELMAREGVQVSVLVARIESEQRIDGVTIYQRRDLFDPEVRAEAKLEEALAPMPDLVHIHQVDDPRIVEVARRRAPVVISAHAYTACPSGVYYFRPGHECTRAHGPGCFPNMLLRGCAHARNPAKLPAKYKSSAGGLQAVSGSDLAISYSSSVDRHLAANAIEHRRIVPYFPTMGARAGSGHAGRRRVVFAGRVVAPKGVDVLVRAAREVDGEFLVCGDGPRLQAMRGLARRLGVEQRVQFTGWLGGSELAQQLANASVVAVPSLWPEPFGLVGIEAFAAGRPAVASATGGVRDWLDDGLSGLCVAPGDASALARALNELLADPQRQQEMGEAGRRTVSTRFSGAQHLTAVLDAYAAARSSWESSPPLR